MADPKSRARVERLLDGKNRTDDLTHLFLYARDRCDGRESVQEIGDFVAHHDERTKGIVTRTVREFFAIANFFGPRFTVGGPHPIDPQNLPSVTPDFLRACFTRLDHSIIKNNTGLSKAQAYKILPSLVRALRKKQDGSFALPLITRDELALFQCLASYMTMRAAFEGNQLFADLCATLKSNGLITKPELQRAPVFKPAVLLFAASIMHNSVIRIEGGSTVKVHARRDVEGIHVSAAVPVMNIGQPNEIKFACDIFTTNISPNEFCDPKLLEIPDWSAIEIELGPEGILTVL
jgi:hypothetical protein